MPKLRLVQERRRTDEESSKNQDLRSLGDKELFNWPAFETHLVVSHLADSRGIEDLCAAYGLEARPHGSFDASGVTFHFTLKNARLGEHKREALLVLVAALELRRRNPKVGCAIAQINSLHRAMGARIRDKALEPYVPEVRPASAQFKLNAPVAAAAELAGLLPQNQTQTQTQAQNSTQHQDPSQEWSDLSEAQIQSIHAVLTGESTAAAEPSRNAAIKRSAG